MVKQECGPKQSDENGGTESPMRASSSADSDLSEDDEVPRKRVKSNNEEPQSIPARPQQPVPQPLPPPQAPHQRLAVKENLIYPGGVMFPPFFPGNGFTPPEFFYASAPFHRDFFMQQAAQFSQYIVRPTLPPLPVPVSPSPVVAKKSGFDVSDLLAKP